MMKPQPKRRSWIAQSAHRTGGGVHRDGREKRQGGRKERKLRAVREHIDWASTGLAREKRR